MQDYAPANFISRISIGVGCVGMYTVQYLMFFSGQAADCAGMTCATAAPRDRVLLLTGLTAVLCLSVVGAVCSGEALPECRGSTAVHYTAAILFFVLYDVLVAVLLLREQRSGRLGQSLRRWLWALGAGSALSKARVLWPLLSARRADGSLASPRDFPGLAVFEWADVGTIISFTQSYVAATCGDLSIALVRARAPSEPPVLWRMNGHKVLAIALRYAFGTLVACLVISIALGTLDKPGLPMISDTFVWPPGNWISRWAGVIGTTYLSLFHLMFWACYRDRVGRVHSYVLLALSLVGGLACSLVMVVSETEDRALHIVSAVSFFVLYDAFVLYYNAIHTTRVLWSSPEEPLLAHGAPAPVSRSRLALLWALWLLSVAAKARFIFSPAAVRSVASVLEWADALCILGFLVTAPAMYHAELAELQFVILRKSKEPSCA